MHICFMMVKLLSQYFYFVGTVEKGAIEVTNCFCVPHKEYEDQVSKESDNM